MSMSSERTEENSSFSTKRINKSTFVVQEDDAYGEHPLIYVKIHSTAPVLIVTDTGCDEPSDRKKTTYFTHLRKYLEECPIESNGNSPLNPHGSRRYIIICTHCHYDHIGGISQFLAGRETEIIASSSGREFIESDLDSHGLFTDIGKDAPCYPVTHWAQHFEQLHWPLSRDGDESKILPHSVDLGITLVPIPGHTPDSLAWYDHEELHLYVGDALYEEGEEGICIIWPGDGNFIEWVFQTAKLQYMVKAENFKLQSAAEKMDADGWVQIAPRVRIACGHQTHSADAEELLGIVGVFAQSVLTSKIPISKTFVQHGEAYHVWREKDDRAGVAFMMPARLMHEARTFFEGTIVSLESGSKNLLPLGGLDDPQVSMSRKEDDRSFIGVLADHVSNAAILAVHRIRDN